MKIDTAILAGLVAAFAVAACAEKASRTPPELAPPVELQRIQMEYQLDQYGFVCYATRAGYSHAPVVVPMSACLSGREPARVECDTDTDCMRKNGGNGDPEPMRRPL